jgi:hypothetical protein
MLTDGRYPPLKRRSERKRAEGREISEENHGFPSERVPVFAAVAARLRLTAQPAGDKLVSCNRRRQKDVQKHPDPD